MFKFIKDIKYYFLSLQEKRLQKRLKSTLSGRYSNKSGKEFYSKGAKLTLNSQTVDKIEQVKKNVAELVKQTNFDSEKLIQYVKATKTPVYRLKNADKILNLIKDEEGIIYEKEGLEALYLSIMTGQGIKFKTEPMFLFRPGQIDKFMFLHHFYRWYSLKSGLGGFDYEVQKLFKQFLIDSSDSFVKRMSMEKIVSLQEAIARDQEATAFVLEYTKQIDGSKNVLNKIKNDGGANI